jgi:hypothetical protein
MTCPTSLSGRRELNSAQQPKAQPCNTTSSSRPPTASPSSRCPAHARAPRRHAATPRLPDRHAAAAAPATRSAASLVSHRPRVRAARGSAAPPPPSFPAVEATAAVIVDRCSAASSKLQTHAPGDLPRRRRRDGQRALAGEQAAQDPLRFQGLPPLSQDRYSITSFKLFPFVLRVKVHVSLTAWVLLLQIRRVGSRRAATGPPSRAPVTRASSGAKRSVSTSRTGHLLCFSFCVCDGSSTAWRLQFHLRKVSLLPVNRIIA